MAEGLGNWPRSFKHWPTRPFSNAHWTLVIAFLGLWEFALFGQPCKEGPYYFEASLAAGTVCIAFWIADLREGVLIGWARIPRVLTLAFYDLCAESSPDFIDTPFFEPAVQTSQATRNPMMSEV